ncbi:MAG TPA: class B sortase, partial [Eubacteriaceae bacterium]|nr:class B sortase [Eubacteriaceae bacterium]
LWEIFSVYVTDIEFDYIKTDFHTDEEYHKFLEEITEKSLFNTNIQPTIEDKIITLSTCSYEFDNGRFVVHGRKINY